MLGRTFRRLAAVIPILVAGSFAMFVLSRWLRPLSTHVVVLGVCAAYGAAAFGAAAWATGALLRLAGALLTDSDASRAASAS